MPRQLFIVIFSIIIFPLVCRERGEELKPLLFQPFSPQTKGKENTIKYNTQIAAVQVNRIHKMDSLAEQAWSKIHLLSESPMYWQPTISTVE